MVIKIAFLIILLSQEDKTMSNTYETIFQALLAYGYDETQSEELIAQLIEDFKEMDRIQDFFHKLVTQ